MTACRILFSQQRLIEGQQRCFHALHALGQLVQLGFRGHGRPNRQAMDGLIGERSFPGFGKLHGLGEEFLDFVQHLRPIAR